MKKNYIHLLAVVCVVSLQFLIFGASTFGQQQNQNTPPQPQLPAEEVIRVSTDLVQTGVSVFDKHGKFVEGLTKEDFELKVDKHPVAVNFFELVATGTSREEIQLAAAGSETRAKAIDTPREVIAEKPSDRGRVVIFFVDDLHIAPDSLKRAKDAIIKYIDKEMGPNDLVAITSARGQIGFLQQYTTNKDVLKMAVGRLTYKSSAARDTEQPIMTDGQAVLINQGDRTMIGHFVGETVRLLNIRPSQAEDIVRRRARILVALSASTIKATLSSLDTLARRSAGLPGRKLIFFISDGFPLDARNSDTLDRLRKIADASLRAGVMIYTMDARGLVTDNMDAAVENPGFGYVASASRGMGENVLNALASDTGGRFIHNRNFLGPELTIALQETSVYYLLAWRPNEAGGGNRFRRIEVRIKNRPELSVRVQRGYFESTNQVEERRVAKGKAAEGQPLRDAINSLFPQRNIPTKVVLSYMDTPGRGSTLVASMKVEADALRFELQAGKTAALVDITGTVFDSEGKALDSFNHHLTIMPPTSAGGAGVPDIFYNYHAALKPGLYQVRVAALDRASGQTGSAVEWLEIPDLSKQRLAMSSLIVGERKPGAEEGAKKSETLFEGVNVSVDRRFERSSNLRFLVYVYNAAHGGGDAAINVQPDITLQLQIFRGNQVVVTMLSRQLSTESQDPTHLAYAAEIPLQELTAGQYVLQITARDRIAQTSASQRTRFEVK